MGLRMNIVLLVHTQLEGRNRPIDPHLIHVAFPTSGSMETQCMF